MEHGKGKLSLEHLVAENKEVSQRMESICQKDSKEANSKKLLQAKYGAIGASNK